MFGVKNLTSVCGFEMASLCLYLASKCTHCGLVIRYRSESQPLIAMPNSCYSNCSLDAERVTEMVDNSQRCDEGR